MYFIFKKIGSIKMLLQWLNASLWNISQYNKLENISMYSVKNPGVRFNTDSRYSIRECSFRSNGSVGSYYRLFVTSKYRLHLLGVAPVTTGSSGANYPFCYLRVWQLSAYLIIAGIYQKLRHGKVLRLGTPPHDLMIPHSTSLLYDQVFNV